jgi:hypothetical protein
LYYSGDQIKKVKMGGALAYMGDRRGACRVLMGIRDGKRPLGRPKPRDENNNKIDL